MAFFSRTPPDSSIMEGICSGGAERRHCERQLYEKYAYLIREGTRKHNLSEHDSSIAYSDAVLTVIEHLVAERFQGRSELKTYLYQIFSNKCVDLIRRNTTNKAQVHRSEGLNDALNLLPDEARTVVQELVLQQDMDLLRHRLRSLGEKCQRILWAWGEGYKDDEIATQLDYQSAAVAKTSRLRCLEKLRELYHMGSKTK
ncbi:RNA polymerase sigma factor [Telluribacter sp. SYSU D00476]|uniref:RNA polymerase sigma factor n=1 Tax=Telluribacter sp. SYSU D00476 TaxID=2811430 RepID=UPI001FF3E0D7|nr:sigma-70 family RNA polymerase sigma factor [Telluribacter sp. SYSU D00476]